MKYCIVLAIIIASCTGCNKNEPDIDSQKVKAWVRPAMEGGNSAAYFSYTNSEDRADTLISIKTSVSSNVQIHESFQTDDGMMGMRERDKIILQPGEQLILEPGGLHVMIMHLNQSIQSSDSVEMIIKWKVAGIDTLMLYSSLK